VAVVGGGGGDAVASDDGLVSTVTVTVTPMSQG
jgi:hypothetical protein